MSSPPTDPIVLSSSPISIRGDRDSSPVRFRSQSVDSDRVSHARHSPTRTRTFNPNDPDARERQRALDVDMAMQLSLARRESVSVSPTTSRPHDLPEPLDGAGIGAGAGVGLFPTFSLREERELELARGEPPRHAPDEALHSVDHVYPGTPTPEEINLPHLSQGHDPDLLVSLPPVHHSDAALPMYQYQAPALHEHQVFDFTRMEDFAREEKKRLGLNSPTDVRQPHLRKRVSQPDGDAEPGPSTSTPEFMLPAPRAPRERKLSQSNAAPRRQGGGKMALFEGGLPGAPPPSLSRGTHLFASGVPAPLSTVPSLEEIPETAGTGVGHDRPYRFSFYSNGLAATIHARSLAELPADGQSFEDLFSGQCTSGSGSGGASREGGRRAGVTSPFLPDAKRPADASGHVNGFGAGPGANGNGTSKATSTVGDDSHTWWLDVLSPTDEEMKMLSQVFHIHPLTTEDIQMEEAREKIELFRTYYLVCFRSFDQDPYSPTYLEPLNMYIIVFREGTLSFHFRATPHPQNVRRRIKQLKDYISVTSDWISYALIDDITDAFGPLIQSIEYEVDSIDELVLILKEAEQSDMLRRIGTCRKKVMGLLRLMGNKADVVKGLAKRCNENWKVAPTSDIGLYLSDIQDHLITMTQNLNHYEKILSRSHSNYLAQISIEMTDANNQINDVLSKLTALGTVLIPMNLVTGLWGMNVHVPGQDVETGYAWFLSIIACLAAFAIIGGYTTYKFMVR
ncbi:cora-domain-containing protein [Auriscalpium vulgare]|uniref:Cora-domain-containing protein n=1 Tax=Auriscalpium vulgare TaxID=40419 RepID=A0ACB8RIW8_9AGAM|nr:cora-domain-containing protein [Auriscalpium vulgare]